MSKETGKAPVPRWGLPGVVPVDAVAAWGARMIVHQDGSVDVLWDRVGDDNGPRSEELCHMIDARFPIRPDLAGVLASLLSSYEMSTREGEDFVLYLDDRMVVHANTNGSHGYCYVTAWLYEEGDTG